MSETKDVPTLSPSALAEGRRLWTKAVMSLRNPEADRRWFAWVQKNGSALLSAAERLSQVEGEKEKSSSCATRHHVFLNAFGVDHTPKTGTRCQCGDVIYIAGAR